MTPLLPKFCQYDSAISLISPFSTKAEEIVHEVVHREGSRTLDRSYRLCRIGMMTCVKSRAWKVLAGTDILARCRIIRNIISKAN